MREVATAIEEICGRLGIRFSAYSDEWVYVLSHEGRTAYVIGHHFGLNGDAQSMICQDKVAASDVLAGAGIPHVWHVLVRRSRADGTMSDASRTYLSTLLAENGRLVLKGNRGTGGNLVMAVGDEGELEEATARILSSVGAMAVCPYIEIREEYRVIVLDGLPRLAYRKVRQEVVGDGVSSLEQLVETGQADGVVDACVDLSLLDLDRVPETGEHVPIEWRHNLGKGAVASLDVPDGMRDKLYALAAETADALGTKFVSVDIIEDTRGELSVLEPNSGVMMEHFLSQGKEFRELGIAVYETAIRLALGMPVE